MLPGIYLSRDAAVTTIGQSIDMLDAKRRIALGLRDPEMAEAFAMLGLIAQDAANAALGFDW